MKTRAETFYDRFAFLYPIVDLFLKPQKYNFIKQINHYPAGRLLEIGVGNGAHLRHFRRHEIIGIDTSMVMLALARSHGNENIQLMQMNGEQLSFPGNAFDYVVLSHVLAVVDNPEKLLDEVHRVLKPNGKVFILNHFTPENWLKYIDRAFATVSNLFHFKSKFKLSDLQKVNEFKLVSEQNAGLFSYFKIVVYEKSR